MDRGAWWATVHGVRKSRPGLSEAEEEDIYIRVQLSKYSLLLNHGVFFKKYFLS